MASKKKAQSDKRDDSNKSEFIQNIKNKPFLYIGTFLILIVIFIAFVFGGINFDFLGSSDLEFGRYNRTPIQFAMNNFFHQSVVSYAQHFQVSPDDPSYMEMEYWIWRLAFEDTVVRAGILDEMSRAGFTAPEDVVDREVASLPMFQENGQFSRTRYRSMDDSSRLALWKQIQESIAMNYYMGDLASLRISSEEASFIASMSSRRRSFDLVSFSASTFPDSEVIAYAMENSSLFSEVHLSMITINSSERDAQQVLNSVRSGAISFEEAAFNNSQDMFADRGGDMGIWLSHELRWEILNEQDRINVSLLAPGSVSDLVMTPYGGWAFFRANQAARPMDPEDEFQLISVRSYIMDSHRGYVEDWLEEQAENFRTQAVLYGFEEAALSMGLTVQSFGPVPINFGDIALFSSVAGFGIPELSGAGSNTFFWDLAFSTPINTVSVPRVIGGNVMILYPTEEILLDEYDTWYLESYYPEWINSSFDSIYRNYFLNNTRLENNFDEVYSRVFWGMN